MLQEGLFEEGLFADSRRARWPSPPCQLVRVDFRACRMHYFCCKRSHQRLYCSAPFWRPFLCLFSPGRPFAGVQGRLRCRMRFREGTISRRPSHFCTSISPWLLHLDDCAPQDIVFLRCRPPSHMLRSCKDPGARAFGPRRTRRDGLPDGLFSLRISTWALSYEKMA